MDELFWLDNEEDLQEVPAQDGSFLEIGKEEETATTQDIVCGICEKVFQNQKNLKRHLLVHSDVPKCKTCKKKFKSEEELMEHNKQKHSTTFVCDQCGNTFERKQSLKRHRTIKHATDDYNALKCPINGCEKVFAVKSIYEDHIHRHANIKPYVCSSCSKSFACRYVRNDHMKNCKTGHKYSCKQCSLEFITRGGLSNHTAAVHRDGSFICQCGKSYKYGTGLANHKKKINH